jgi:putative transposase
VIDGCRDQYPIRLMCRCLKVSPSGYYAWKARRPGKRARENAELASRIEVLHSDSDGVKGSRRIWRDLRENGSRCSLNRVERLMRLQGLQGIPQRRKWRRKASSVRPGGVENLLERDFKADVANARWVTDITYIRTEENWLYLCVVLDLANDVVVGWSMGARQDRELVLRAVLMSLGQRQGGGPTILHSDKGAQFTSDEYQRFLRDHGLVSSMSAVGSCADNAAAEGFFGRLKRERVNRRNYRTRAEARTDVFDYIERVHNAGRRRRMELKAIQSI